MEDLRANNEKRGSFKLIIAVAIFIGIAIIMSSISINDFTGKVISREEAKIENFTTCLANQDVRILSSSKDRAFKMQKSLFGKYFDLISYVDCLDEPNKCSGILTHPTWRINGRVLPGAQTLENLAKITGCEL